MRGDGPPPAWTFDRKCALAAVETISHVRYYRARSKKAHRGLHQRPSGEAPTRAANPPPFKLRNQLAHQRIQLFMAASISVTSRLHKSSCGGQQVLCDGYGTMQQPATQSAEKCACATCRRHRPSCHNARHLGAYSLTPHSCFLNPRRCSDCISAFVTELKVHSSPLATTASATSSPPPPTDKRRNRKPARHLASVTSLLSC